jgi:predicted RNA-binding Zn ribbon-like protein
MVEDVRWPLADPQLAVGLLGTLRRRGDALAGDDLPEDPEAIAWVQEHTRARDTAGRAGLIGLRELMRKLFLAVLNGDKPPAEAIAALNDLAAQAPVNLTARRGADGTIAVERTSPGPAFTVLQADLARSALALLAAPARDRLRLCRAPGCSLFFLTGLRHQQWCSADCGNRARVARHYTQRATGRRAP